MLWTAKATYPSGGKRLELRKENEIGKKRADK